jgi:hypothetical protein
MQEIWKDVVNYEGYYQISNFGVVKSLKRYRVGNKGALTLVKEKFLKPKFDRYGYLIQPLCKDKKVKHIPTHRLVCMAFVENINPIKFNQINHIDGNKLNNNPHNLEWCDAKHNMKEAFRLGLRGGKPYKPRVDSSKIDQFYKTGELVKTYISLAEAERLSGVYKNAISNCLNGRAKTSGGFVWKYNK